MNHQIPISGGVRRFARLSATPFLCLALFATPAAIADEHGAFNYIHEVAGWKYEQDIGWLFSFDAGGGSEYLYSFDHGWMWHQPDYGGWVFSWGFVQAQWTLKPTLVRAVQRQAIAHPMDVRPQSDFVAVVDHQIVGNTLRATVEYPGSGPFSTFFLYVQDSLDGSEPHDVEAWVVRNSRGDTGTGLVREDLTFDLAVMDGDWGRDAESFTLQLNHTLLAAAVVEQATHDTADITWSTSRPASVTIEYGLSPEDLTMSAASIDAGSTFHTIGLYDLEIDATYHYRVVVSGDDGEDLTSPLHTFATNAVQMASEVSQFGITWTFDGQYPVGRFANGDWWVVGPVQVVEVDPAPGPHTDSIADRITLNQWGDTSLRNNNDWGNGSMVVMTPGGGQAYDSRNSNYNQSMRIQFPYELGADRSLISSISHTADDGYPSQVMHHGIMWPSEQNGGRVMRTAAVLTSLSEAPPGDAFRPTYIGAEKKLFLKRDLQWDRLHNLEVDRRQVPVPSWSQFERYYERPWLDHLNGSWQGQLLLPSENQPAYGREFARIHGTSSMMLHLDVPRRQKEKLLVGLVQIGIDLRGIVELGGRWNEGGGHTSGRKWPILFAGLMLDEEGFLDMPETAIFHEDTQTYWGRGWHQQRALWQMITHHGTRQPYLHLHPSTWSEHDGGWASTSESYRRCCNAISWPGQTLAALLMEAKGIWNHDVYFEVVDDWMRQKDIYASQRLLQQRAGQETSAFSPYDDFVTIMYRLFRDTVPEQPHGDEHRMWDVNRSGANKWVPNEMPTDLGPPVYGDGGW